MKLAVTLPNKDSQTALNLLIDIIVTKYPNLTVSGMTVDDEFDVELGIYNAGKDAVIVISDEYHYNVDWFPNKKSAQNKGVTNFITLDSHLSFYKVAEFLDKLNNAVSMPNKYDTVSEIDFSFVRKANSPKKCRASWGSRKMRPDHSNDLYTRYDDTLILNRPLDFGNFELIGFLEV